MEQSKVEANTQERELTCKERVRKSCTNRYKDVMALFEAWYKGEEEVKDLGTIHDYALSFDYVEAGTFTDQKIGYFRYQISYGGPSEEFRIYTNQDLSPYKIEFWFLDWFDGAKVLLTGKRFDKFTDFFINFFVDSGTARRELEKAIYS